MGRVSLTEDYDDRSVISKLNEMDKRVTENTTVVTSAEASAKASAQAAQETADRFAGSVGAVVQNANAQINASKAQVDQAKAEVDETVTTVAQAVQTANQASASAQQSANTVATYDDRLTATETKNGQQDTAISALQTADTQNVKIEGAQTINGEKTFSKNIIVKHGSTPIYIVRNDVASTSSPTTATDYGYTFRDKDNTETGTIFQHIGTDKNSYLCARTKSWATGSRKDCEITLINNADGSRYVTVSPTPTATVPSNAIVTKGYVESTDGETNNLVHRSANEKVNGIKTFLQRVDFDSSNMDLNNPPSYANRGISQVNTGPNLDIVAMREEMVYSTGGNSIQFTVHAHGEDEAHTDHSASLVFTVFRDGTARLQLVRESGTVQIVPRG